MPKRLKRAPSALSPAARSSVNVCPSMTNVICPPPLFPFGSYERFQVCEVALAGKRLVPLMTRGGVPPACHVPVPYSNNTRKTPFSARQRMTSELAVRQPSLFVELNQPN